MQIFKKIGFVIADDSEFTPIEKYAENLGAKSYMKNGDKYINFTFANHSIVAVLCGIGKVNAAGGTAHLIDNHSPDCIINFGLSGAVSGVYKNEILLGTAYVEHDFDLTPLGYKFGEKPSQKYIYSADKKLADLICSAYPDIAKGVCVSGDMFVSSSELQKKIVDNFGGNCCDMESAAIASVCHKNNLPFAAIRVMSDDADDCAAHSYREKNDLQEDILLKIALKAIESDQ